MGKSPKIQEVQKTQDNFQSFLTDIQGKLKEKCDREAQDFDSKVDSFYKEHGYDQIVIGEGEKWDYRLSSEFGIMTLKDRIHELMNSVFGIVETSDEGTKTVDSTENGNVSVEVSKEVVTALKTIHFYKNLAATAATNFLVGMLDVFGTSLEVTTTHNYSAQQVAPGLTLHIDLYSDSYADQQFLKEEKIIENYMRFKLIYSYELATTISAIQSVNMLIGKICEQEMKLTDFDNQFFDLSLDMTVSDEKLAILQKRSDSLHLLLDKSKAELENYKKQAVSGSMEKNTSSGPLKSVGVRIPRERLEIQRSILTHYE